MPASSKLYPRGSSDSVFHCSHMDSCLLVNIEFHRIAFERQMPKKDRILFSLIHNHRVKSSFSDLGNTFLQVIAFVLRMHSNDMIL